MHASSTSAPTGRAGRLLNKALTLPLTRPKSHRNMLVCPIIPDKKLAFVAIPKNAGTSIRVAFGVAQGFIAPDEPVTKVHSKPWPGVPSKRKIEWLGRLGYLRFSVIRNPWERFVSCWQNKRNAENFLRMTRGLFRPDMDFPSFLETAFSVPEEAANRHYQTQVGFIHHEGRLLVDRFLRFETLGADWESLRTEFDLPPLPHYKRTGADASWKQVYAQYPGTRERVTERYAADIERFDYRFD